MTQESEKNESFIPEIEKMDLTPLKDHKYVVAVNSGSRNDGRLLAKTLSGPYDFYEMIEAVNDLWVSNQDNAKVYILSKDRKKKRQWLDANTVDYLIAHCADIICEGMLEGAFDEPNPDAQFTCVAKIIEDVEEGTDGGIQELTGDLELAPGIVLRGSPGVGVIQGNANIKKALGIK